MSELIAYHGNAAEKDAILSQLAVHRAADEIVQGFYWENGKGCAVGCTIHSDNHAEYERRFGIPRILAHLEDRLFEGLPNSAAKGWPERFMSAIRPGANLAMVWPRFALWLLTDELLPRATKTPKCAAVIADVAALYREWCESGKNPNGKRWSAAAAAAYAAAYAAAAAAAYAAYAAAPAYAYDADEAADAAADAYAYDADKIRCYQRMADKLIEILEAA